MQTFLVRVIIIIILAGSVSIIHTQVQKNNVYMLEDSPSAVCILYPTEGNETSGIVKFTLTPGGIKIHLG